MTRAQIETLVQRSVDAFNRHDPTGLSAQYAPNSIVESPMFANLRGRKAIEEAWQTFFTSFPDATITLDTVVVDPPRVAVFLKIKATHAGEFYGLAPTHKHILLPLARLVETADGLITHERRIYDFTGLLVQVGVLRAKPAG
jgi:predicted ester cyclase